METEVAGLGRRRPLEGDAAAAFRAEVRQGDRRGDDVHRSRSRNPDRRRCCGDRHRLQAGRSGLRRLHEAVDGGAGGVHDHEIVSRRQIDQAVAAVYVGRRAADQRLVGIQLAVAVEVTEEQHQRLPATPYSPGLSKSPSRF